MIEAHQADTEEKPQLRKWFWYNHHHRHQNAGPQPPTPFPLLPTPAPCSFSSLLGHLTSTSLPPPTTIQQCEESIETHFRSCPQSVLSH